MGDAADLDFGENLDFYLTHLRGECDGPCPYCEDEAEEEE